MKRGIYEHEALMVELHSVKGAAHGETVEKVGKRLSAYVLDMAEVEAMSPNEIGVLMGKAVQEAVEYDLRESDESYVQSKEGEVNP